MSEAELAVALFTFLVLRGTNPKDITILCSEPAQVSLVEEITLVKTSWHQSLGKPYTVTTFERYQGQRNKIVIYSLVRSNQDVCRSLSLGKHSKRYTEALTSGTHASLVLASPSWFAAGNLLDQITHRLRNTEHKEAGKPGNLFVLDGSVEREIRDADGLYEIAKKLVPQI